VKGRSSWRKCESVTADHGMNPLFKEGSPARALGNPIRHAPRARSDPVPDMGPGSTCHTPREPVSECGEGEPSSQEQTVTHDRTSPRGR
jgi:hypothetical protein